jgi:hypothetical protein
LYGLARGEEEFRGTGGMRSVWIRSVLVAGLSIAAGSTWANASETPKANQTTPSAQSSAATPSNSSSPSGSSKSSTSSSKTTSSQTNEPTKPTPSGKTYQNYPANPDRYTDEGDSVSTRRTSDRRSYRVTSRPVEYRHVEYRHVEYRRSRVVHVERHHYRRVYRHVVHGRPLLAAPVYYYGQLVGRDPDGSVRLMILKDNARTMWAR